MHQIGFEQEVNLLVNQKKNINIPKVFTTLLVGCLHLAFWVILRKKKTQNNNKQKSNSYKKDQGFGIDFIFIFLVLQI